MTYRGKKYFSKEQISSAVSTSISKHEVLKKLGLPLKGTSGYRVLNFFLEKHEVSFEHFTTPARATAFKNATPLQDILTGKHPTFNTNTLKKKLIKEGIFEHRCAVCKLEEWLGQPIPIDLDHINGKSWDHRLENLRIICRNCHAQTDNFCGKNRK